MDKKGKKAGQKWNWNHSGVSKGKKPGQNIQEKEKGDLCLEWFYMTDQAITAEDLFHYLEDRTGYQADVWKELGVLEIEVSTEGCMDFRQIEPDLGDEYSNQFLADHQVKTLFSVDFSAEVYQEALAAMKSVTDEIGGFFCADTEDFMPVIPTGTF